MHNEHDASYRGIYDCDLVRLNEIDDPSSPFKAYSGFTGGFQHAGIYLVPALDPSSGRSQALLS